MRKRILIFVFFVSAVFVLASCQSRGPKCPGMYSHQNNTENKVNPS